ncbi:COP9 signalosome complex subunit 9 isoform X1 [Takifugu rubripes]|uniref:COP9 signalosome complex subunit 9 isoform X1 n=1 Tax=Takifugu rubripes TaxID=31033 RepID=UPI000065E8F4|nr:COP9 signalosome complex subunit 9 isoform X1 [Takifugu rubripes]XP_056913079.1 COP9 signalosome complex subunit 9 isoform X1 [Takifugu flavidus]
MPLKDQSNSTVMKPAVDEMFPEGAGPYVDLDEAGGSTGLLMDLAANEKAVHSDFFNGSLCSTDCSKTSVGSIDFEDLFDDDDIQ